MIAYCPLDLDEKNTPRTPSYKQPKRIQYKQRITENTECNYIVMFFVIGVFILAVSDQFRK